MNAPTKTKPRARPIDYTPELADEICETIATTPRGLDYICDRNDGFPHASTVHRWLNNQPGFSEKYTRARERQADLLADESLEIADDGSNDWIEKRNEAGEVIDFEYNGDAVQRSRLRIDTRKWYASKLAPKKYGDKLDLTAQTQVTHVVDEVDLAALSSDERDMLRQVAQTLLARKAQALEDRRGKDE